MSTSLTTFAMYLKQGNTFGDTRINRELKVGCFECSGVKAQLMNFEFNSVALFDRACSVTAPGIVLDPCNPKCICYVFIGKN